MALFRGIQEYIALHANDITLVEAHPILYKYLYRYVNTPPTPLAPVS